MDERDYKAMNKDSQKESLKDVDNSGKVPHRCPICGGNGIVSGGFYTTLNGCTGLTTNLTEQCKQCSGTGILWS